MSSVVTIAFRDIRSAFFSPVAYGLFSVFLCVSGYFFFNLLGSFNFAVAQEAQAPIGDIVRTLNLNEWVVQGFFQTILLLLVFIVPLVTMRAFSEERQNGTYLLLSSLPVSVFDVIAGKFLGCFALVAVMLLFSFTLPLGLCAIADPELLPVLSGCVGLLIAATAFVAIGVALAALFQNSLLSGVFTLAVLIVLYGAHAPAESMNALGQSLLRYVSPLWQLRDLFRGLVTPAPFAYFFSLTLLSLVLGSIGVFSESRRR